MRGGIKIKHFLLLLTLLLSVAYIRRILLKTTYTQERRPYKLRKLQHSTLIINNQFNSKQIIQILQSIIIDY